MRVCELANRAQTSIFEVIRQAEELDIEAYSPLTELDDDEVKQLQSVLNKRSPQDIEKDIAERVERRERKLKAVVERFLDKSAGETAALREHRDKALEMDALLRGKTPVPAESGKPSEEQSGGAVETAAEERESEPVETQEIASPEPVPEKKIEKPVEVKVPEREKPATKPASKPAAAQKKPVSGKNIAERRVMQRGAENRKPPASRGEARSVPSQPVAKTSPKPAVNTGKTVSPDRIITLRGAVVLKDLAERMGLRPNRLIADLMQMNMLVSINERIELDVATKLTDKYGFKIELERQKRSSERKPQLKSEADDDQIPDDKIEEMVLRPPVVTFLGHVDHGKTSLMDRIRNARVASGEAGGITQHMGAYTLEVNGRKITFLDTPGHAAFSSMRERGANMTDIAVIIIAADDGIMPQTREAIRHAQAAGVQIMVAINKCDLPDAQPDKVRQMLQAEGLTPEEWGGDVITVEVSAQTGTGLDHLLEMILLQSDMLELMANPDRRADGVIVEAQLEQGLGPTATLLVQGGTLNVGDVLLCGEYFGKLRGLINDRGRKVKSAGPSTAVKCMGLSGVPEAGARFRVMLNEKRARTLAAEAAESNKMAQLATAKPKSLEAMMMITGDTKREQPVIVKADTQGSLEAIIEAFKEIKSDKVSLNIISSGIGNISATDVNKAAAGSAVIVGFNVGTETGVQQMARHDSVRISTFRIIYELMEFVIQRMLNLLSPEFKEVVKGHAEIRAIFNIGKTGRVAGCQMLDGSLLKNGRFRIKRGDKVIFEGTLAVLKHFQQEVTEISGSQECGILFNGFEGFAEGDIVECYVQEELPRTL
ncbi:MAG: translation initiation factor IF-2 [Kiritimatiellia bacterium]